ncbi:MAG: dynamin family protein [Pseudomonadota bacterium]
MKVETEFKRPPRMIVTGEFSAGKTRFINGLIGRSVLPSNVTSTSLPPVWLIYGDDVSFRIDLDGNVHEVESFAEVDVHDTLVYVNAVPAEILRHVDIIDTPGNSDPNIPATCWERMVGHADMMVWCTGATQAWRQSEKATVRDLPEDLRAQGLLLITQADRIPEERQREKLKRRVARDAAQFLPEIRMASLIDDAEVAKLRDEIIAMAEATKTHPGAMLEAIENVRATALDAAEPLAMLDEDFETEPGDEDSLEDVDLLSLKAQPDDADNGDAASQNASAAEADGDADAEVVEAKADVKVGAKSKSKSRSKSKSKTKIAAEDEQADAAQDDAADKESADDEGDLDIEALAQELMTALEEDGDADDDVAAQDDAKAAADAEVDAAEEADATVATVGGSSDEADSGVPKVGLELLEAVTKRSGGRRSNRRRGPALALADADVTDAADTNSGETPTSRMIWDALEAAYDGDDEARIDAFIACIDQLFMPKDGDDEAGELVARMKDAAEALVTSEDDHEGDIAPLTSSAGS